jgi:hypothetical protein
MKYVFLIYTDETVEPQVGTPEFDEMMTGYYAFTEAVQSKGIMERGAPLEQSDTATTVRVRDGRMTTTDGPFAETKEQLGGFYMLDCQDLDEAIEYAARIPGASIGSVEIRPVRILPTT